MNILWPVRCQDVKMSRLVGGHLIDRKMSRCQDVKMSRLMGGHLMAHEMSRGFWAIIVRCQDVKMSRCLDRGVRVVRCRAVSVKKS